MPIWRDSRHAGEDPDRLRRSDDEPGATLGWSSPGGRTRQPSGIPWAEGIVLVTGAGGMLGRAMTERLGARAAPFRHSELDISDRQAVAAALDRAGPRMVINCAAATDVDRCEIDHAYADSGNAVGPQVLAEACGARGVGLVHVSTDYVFNGDKGSPYVEDDRPGPLSYYAQSKFRGEEAVLAATPDLPGLLVVRTSWVFGPGGPGASNFPMKVVEWARRQRRLRVACDQWGSPTYAPFLAHGITALLEAGAMGLYHLAGDGCASRLDLAREVVTAAGLEVEVEPARAAEFPAAAPRPTRSCLDCSRAAGLGARLPTWQTGVRRYVGELLGERSPRADNG